MLRVFEGKGLGNLKVGVPEGLHHLLGGVGARSITLTADNLVLGGQAQFSGQVVFGLSAAGVDRLVLGFAVAVIELDNLKIYF